MLILPDTYSKMQEKRNKVYEELLNKKEPECKDLENSQLR